MSAAEQPTHSGQEVKDLSKVARLEELSRTRVEIANPLLEKAAMVSFATTKDSTSGFSDRNPETGAFEEEILQEGKQPKPTKAETDVTHSMLGLARDVLFGLVAGLTVIGLAGLHGAVTFYILANSLWLVPLALIIWRANRHFFKSESKKTGRPNALAVAGQAVVHNGRQAVRAVTKRK